MEKHRKHANLTRRNTGFFGSNEIALLGTNCSTIKTLVEGISSSLGSGSKIAYVDASHDNALEKPVVDVFTFHHSGNLDMKRAYDQNSYSDTLLFSSYDLLLINGNHYQGARQIVFLDPEKEASIKKRIDQITDISCLILMDPEIIPFDCLYEKFPELDSTPRYHIDELEEIVRHIETSVKKETAEIRGLVLAGGKSLRMGKDKGLLDYFGKSQRSYSLELLQKVGLEAFLSVRKEQHVDEEHLIEDVFLGLGPFGAICSAFQYDPNTAWLTLATDLPYVDEGIVRSLLDNRDPKKIATAVKGKDKPFPEPLITIWEPKAYPIMLQYLARGISCPRKVLINSDVKLIETDDAFLVNVNTPEEFRSVKNDLARH